MFSSKAADTPLTVTVGVMAVSAVSCCNAGVRQALQTARPLLVSTSVVRIGTCPRYVDVLMFVFP